MIERCEGCGIYPGGRVCNAMFDEYRGHIICDWCRAKWKRYEKRFNRTIGFEEFQRGIKDGAVEIRKERYHERKEQIGKQAQEGKTVKDLAGIFKLTKRTIYRALGGK